MLKSLYIKNFAIIREQSIFFAKGLNVLLGETGAGKSLIISALNIVAGARATTDIIRIGESKSIIEAIFENSENTIILDILRKNDIEILQDDLILRRELNVNGNSRAFINDTPVTNKLLREVSGYLLDFHAQHDSYTLLSSGNHVSLLDLCGVESELIVSYKNTYLKLKKLCDEYFEFKQKEIDLKEREHLVKFKLEEILSINPKKGELEDLEKELEVIENAEFLKNSCYEVNYALYNSEGAIIDKLRDIQKQITTLSEYNKELVQYCDELESNIISLKEINTAIADYKDDIKSDEFRAEEIRKRIFSLKNLQKKFGSLDLLIASIPDLQSELEDSENYTEKLNDMFKNIRVLQNEITDKDTLLLTDRLLVFKKLKFAVENTLMDLGIKNPNFDIISNKREANSEILFCAVSGHDYFTPFVNGVTQLEFYISTNLGQEPKPLSEVASGGEISRIMLAIKSHLAQKDNMPLMIFDEIDTGISGQIAKKVADRMKSLSKSIQIIAISHQPQLAALADNPIYIEKSEIDGNTFSISRILDKNELLTEVAKMLGSGNISDNILQTAKELTEN